MYDGVSTAASAGCYQRKGILSFVSSLSELGENLKIQKSNLPFDSGFTNAQFVKIDLTFECKILKMKIAVLLSALFAYANDLSGSKIVLENRAGKNEFLKYLGAYLQTLFELLKRLIFTIDCRQIYILRFHNLKEEDEYQVT